MNKKFAIGIDLGTTNSALAYCALDAADAAIECLALPQFVATATLEERLSLPSFQYIATAEEVASGTYNLPWEQGKDHVVGAWARTQSAEVPTRSIAAAKSWLTHSRVDRRSPILPWNAPADVNKKSPVEVSADYLRHLASTWNNHHPETPIAEQEVVLTVPASFDAAARELTREAAMKAGLPEQLILLEEPQSAVYAWLANQGEAWRKDLNEGDTLLVCDVGGGTTDFSLIGVESEDGELILKRIAVGNHILVGGDNMDLSLAHVAQGLFAEQGTEVDAWQAVALWHASRSAKEQLLSPEGPEQHPVTILGRGSKLIGGTVSIDLSRELVTQTLLEGFLPACALQDTPTRNRRSGFQEIGLPFESDTAITRHLASFLNQHGEAGEALRPTHILFNGGVLKATALQERLTEVTNSWFPEGEGIRNLAGTQDLDFSVARGAAYYAFAKHGEGIRIRGGVGRSYYMGIETAGLAIPGAPRPLNALCVVPFGMEEGTSIEVPSAEFGLVVGEPAHFRFFHSTVRQQDEPGQMIRSWEPEELVESDSLEATLSRVHGVEDDFVPVTFQSRITELGMFELWCRSAISDDQWKLEFNVRDSS